MSVVNVIVVALLLLCCSIIVLASFPRIRPELTMSGGNVRAADARLALARKFDIRIKKLVRRTNRDEARIAVLLSTMDRGDLYVALRHESLNAYAFEVTGWEAT